MTDPVKRLNYYDHQFLRVPDFNAEQNYNLSMRRLHNRALHTWGIVEGLQVAPKVGGSSPTAITVNQGVALDSNGQEMVLPADKDLELGGEADKTTLYITIAYGEQPSDPTTEAGGPGNTRITESPNVTFSRDPPPPAETGKTLILAKVARVTNGLGVIDLSDRRQAGAVAGSNITVDTVTLRNGGVPQANWPTLTCSASNQVNLANAGLAVNGHVGIGTVTPHQDLTISRTGATLGVFSSMMNSNHELVMGVDGKAIVSAMTASDLELRTNNTMRVVVKANTGNVGIGTWTPGARLQVAGSALLDGGSLAFADTAGETATQLRSYNKADSLWMLQADRQRFVLADSVDWDRGVMIQYTAGTTGAGAGGMLIGQLFKNSATFTHGYTALFTNGAERMRVNAAGNVGIGTAAPIAKLHVHGHYSNDGSGGIVLDATDSGNPDQYSLRINPFGIASAQVGYQFQTRSQVGGTRQPLTFDHAGNVGIGTTLPQGAHLHVGPPNANASLRIGPVNWRGTAADATTYGLERSRNQILFSTWRDQTTDKIGAKIVGINKQTYGAANGRDLIQSTDLVFFTVPPGQMNNYDDTVERMRIMDTGIVQIGGLSGGLTVGPWPANPTGYVCFGTNALDQTSAGGGGNYALLQGAGAETGRTFLNSPKDIAFRINNVDKMFLRNNGDFEVTGTAIKPSGGPWATPSDRALKKDIAPIEGALEKILQLRGVSFAWREPEKHNATDRRYMGMVAQDVEPVFPEWVKPMQDGHKALEPIGFEGLVVEAIRQLSDRCERLEAELAQLRAPAGERDVVAPLRKAG